MTSLARCHLLRQTLIMHCRITACIITQNWQDKKSTKWLPRKEFHLVVWFWNIAIWPSLEKQHKWSIAKHISTLTKDTLQVYRSVLMTVTSSVISWGVCVYKKPHSNYKIVLQTDKWGLIGKTNKRKHFYEIKEYFKFSVTYWHCFAICLPSFF